MYGENKKDIIFLGINSENRSDMISFMNSKKHIIPTITDEQASDKYQIRAYPTMFILDKDGNILNYVIGSVPQETLKKYIDINLLQKTF